MSIAIRAWVILSAFALAVPLSVFGQTLSEERGRVLRVFGLVEQIDANLFPAGAGTGLIRTLPITRSGADSLRLHFAHLDDDSVNGTWEVRVRQNNEILWRFSGDDLTEYGIWSDEFDGDRVHVELHSTSPNNRVKIRIDLVAATDKQATPDSITGKNQMTSIDIQDPWIQELGKSVARLRFIGVDRKIYTCTAFIIAKQLMLTNEHCISNDEEMHSVLVDFDFDSDIANTTFTRLNACLARNHDLDYAVVRLAKSIDRQPLALSDAAPSDDENLVIVQHPGGEPKMVSEADCRVAEATVAGRGDTATDFSHLCDTLGGSSGSPIFSTATRTVVGLHHLGFKENDPKLHNRGVHIGLILDDLPEEIREILDTVAPVEMPIAGQ